MPNVLCMCLKVCMSSEGEVIVGIRVWYVIVEYKNM